MRLSIFQRMLIAPVVAITIYGAYLTITYGEHKRASEAIEAIRDDSLPVLALAGENLLLFDDIVTQLKDAVLAGEKEWLVHTVAEQAKVEENLRRMAHYRTVVSPEVVRQLQDDFSLYYRNAYDLSLHLLGEGEGEESRDLLIANVERYHNAVSTGLVTLRDGVRQRVNEAVETTNYRLNQLLFMGVTIGVVLLVLVVAVTFTLSMQTRRSLCEIVGGMRGLAEGNPDFSKRLVPHSQDELAALVGWFNLLSEKLEQDYKKIELLSITDKLTQLYNRTRIDQLFAEEVRRAERYGDPFSVILLDLDHFKSVNDNHGHQVGDTVLQELARLLSDGVRETDHVGRWGGEEFIVITPSSGLADGLKLAEKLREQIGAFDFSEVGQKTASFGVAAFRPGDSEESITRRADEALYIAKERGRNMVVSECEVAAA